MVYSYNGKQHSNKKETTDTHKNKSQKHYAK